MFSAYPPARLRSFCSSTVLRLCSFSRIASRARCAHDAAESDTHESSARAYTRSGAHLSRPPVTLSRILVAPPPCDPVSSSLPSAWPRSSVLVAPSDAGCCSRPRCIPRGTTAPVSFVYRVLRASVCVTGCLTSLSEPLLGPAFPSPSHTLPLALFTTLPSLLFPFTQLYLSSLSLASSLAAPLPTPRPSRVYPLCAGGCFFRLFVLASSRAGNRRRRRRRR